MKTLLFACFALCAGSAFAAPAAPRSGAQHHTMPAAPAGTGSGGMPMKILLAAAVALCAAATVSLAAEAQLPVRSVSLFSSGVGYFQHAGTVTGDDSAELRFKASQINDVLKSLVLQDLDGGRVAAVTYPSQDPLDKTLRSFRVNLTANPSLAELLNQLRGARVTVGLGTDKLTGTVVGVETRQRPVGDKANLASLPYLNLLVPTGVRSVALDEVRELAFDDPGLQDELGKALAALAQARDQDKKPVTVRFVGQGQRRVRLGYVVETPVWKTSYRLVLPVDDGKAKPKVQGWALVENQTDGDWNDVSLSLVSGRPISFVQDLYQPLYVVRPVVKPAAFANLRPPSYEAGLGAVAAATAPAPSRGARAMMKAAVEDRSKDQEELAPLPMGATTAEAPLDVAASVSSLASGASVGALFHYTVDGVTLARQKSAMLPIVTDDLKAERVSIYNPAVLPRNPLNGVWLTNTTGKHLLQGPVTVFDGGGYAGDARLDDVPAGQERLLSYGVDLEVTVDSEMNREDAAIQSGRIVKGFLRVTRKYVASRQYTAQSRAERDKVLIVEHAFRHGWKLVDTEAPAETTRDLYRFRTRLAAGKTEKLTVREELVQDDHVALLPAGLEAVLAYSRTGELPKAVRDALAEAARLKQALVDAEREIDQRERAVDEITQEQGRLRENMRTVAANSAYYNRLLEKLNEQETQIERIRLEREGLEKTREARRKALEDYLQNLAAG